MSKRRHVSETPATAMLRAHGVAFEESVCEWQPHGGDMHSTSLHLAAQLGMDAHAVIKTLIMQDAKGQPLVVLMHGDQRVNTQALARQIGAKSVQPCAPEVASKYSGYLVGGTSPFGTRRAMPVYIEQSILALPRIAINGGRRGYVLHMAPQVCVDILGAQAVQCAVPL